MLISPLGQSRANQSFISCEASSYNINKQSPRLSADTTLDWWAEFECRWSSPSRLYAADLKLCFLETGLYSDHLCGALLWRLRDERSHDQLREELQPAALHVHHAVHEERPAAGGAERAVQEEDHPHHHARLSLRQDANQRHPEGRGGGELLPLFYTHKSRAIITVLCIWFTLFIYSFLTVTTWLTIVFTLHCNGRYEF